MKVKRLFKIETKPLNNQRDIVQYSYGLEEQSSENQTEDKKRHIMYNNAYYKAILDIIFKIQDADIIGCIDLSKHSSKSLYSNATFRLDRQGIYSEDGCPIRANFQIQLNGSRGKTTYAHVEIIYDFQDKERENQYIKLYASMESYFTRKVKSAFIDSAINHVGYSVRAFFEETKKYY